MPKGKAVKKKPGRPPKAKPIEKTLKRTVEEAPETEQPWTRTEALLENIEKAVNLQVQTASQQIELTAKFLQFFELLLVQSTQILDKGFVENKDVREEQKDPVPEVDDGVPPPKYLIKDVNDMFDQMIASGDKDKAVKLLRKFTDGTPKDLKEDEYPEIIRLGYGILNSAKKLEPEKVEDNVGEEKQEESGIEFEEIRNLGLAINKKHGKEVAIDFLKLFMDGDDSDIKIGRVSPDQYADFMSRGAATLEHGEVFVKVRGEL